MQRKLTMATLDTKPPKVGRVEIRDKDSQLVFRVTDKGAKSLSVRTRYRGEQTRFTYPKAVTVENLSDARRWAQTVIDKCKSGVDPREEERERKRAAQSADANRFESVAGSFIDRYAKKKNRTWGETERLLERYVYPDWRDRTIVSITRRDVADLLDKIEDRRIAYNGEKIGGAVTADRVLAAVRKLFNWHAARDDSFVSPIVRGMGRTKPADRKRDRVLSDDEIRAMWRACGAARPSIFGAFVRTLLLTAQRRDEVGAMLRSELDPEDAARRRTLEEMDLAKFISEKNVWVIPAARYKSGRANVVPLSTAARAIIDSAPRIGEDSDVIFTTDGETPFSGFSKAKATLDVDMLAILRERDPKAKLTPWRLHDLRRTARSIMSRAGARPDIAERVLGHVIPGVAGVYDRHGYLPEKRDALRRLRAMLWLILASGRRA